MIITVLSLLIEIFSAAVFIVPAMLMLDRIYWHQCTTRKKVLLAVVFCYLTAMFSITGTPTITFLTFDPQVQLVPILNVISSPLAYLETSLLNILLFVPLGILLPLIWDKYRSAKNTMIAGLLLSAGIECAQIFTHRLTDIDDLIFNVAGSLLGYIIFVALPAQLKTKLQVEKQRETSRYELAILTFICFAISLLLTPLLSNAIWEWIVASKWWAKIS